MNLRSMLSGLLVVTSTRISAQQAPADVVRAFFTAERENRWLDAARMLDLASFERIREQTVEGMKHWGDFRRLTVDDLMRSDPSLPRAVAEYQVREFEPRGQPGDYIARQFARVTSVDSVAAMPVEEAAARWLEAESPEWQTELQWRDPRARRQMKCAGMTDSAARAMQLEQSRATRARILGATPESGNASYVVIETVFPGTEPADTLRVGGPLPRAIRVSKIAGTWKIAASTELPNANGMGGNYTFAACATGTGVMIPIPK